MSKNALTVAKLYFSYSKTALVPASILACSSGVKLDSKAVLRLCLAKRPVFASISSSDGYSLLPKLQHGPAWTELMNLVMYTDTYVTYSMLLSSIKVLIKK